MIQIISFVALLTAATWMPLATWSGNGTKETESFTPASREWRMTWKTTKGKDGFESFQVAVYNEKDQIVSSASKTGLGEETSYVRGTGAFYLKINSTSVNWTITVEDQR